MLSQCSNFLAHLGTELFRALAEDLVMIAVASWCRAGLTIIVIFAVTSKMLRVQCVTNGGSPGYTVLLGCCCSTARSLTLLLGRRRMNLINGRFALHQRCSATGTTGFLSPAGSAQGAFAAMLTPTAL